jgi:hypothetical protein
MQLLTTVFFFVFSIRRKLYVVLKIEFITTRLSTTLAERLLQVCSVVVTLVDDVVVQLFVFQVLSVCQMPTIIL